MLIDYISRYYSADTGGDGGTSSAETQNTDAPPPEHMIPKSRFDEVNKELQTLRQQQQQREQAEKQAADRQAAEKGQFEKLATERGARLAQIEAEHQSAQAALAARDALLEQQVKARLKNLPEAARSKMPAGDVIAQISWLDAVEAATQAALPRTPGTPGGPRGSGAPGAPANPLSDLIAEKRARIGGL